MTRNNDLKIELSSPLHNTKQQDKLITASLAQNYSFKPHQNTTHPPFYIGMVTKC